MFSPFTIYLYNYINKDGRVSYHHNLQKKGKKKKRNWKKKKKKNAG